LHRFRAGQRDAAKVVRLGYPVVTPFASTSEANAYLDNAKLTCLLCGKEYAGLYQHLTRTHSVTVEEYQEKYNLPRSRGLVGTNLASVLSEVRKKAFAEGRLPQCEGLWKFAKNNAPNPTSAFSRLARREINADPSRGKLKPLPLETRTCPTCGSEFQCQRWTKKKYCGARCIGPAHYRGDGPLARSCVSCGCEVATTSWYRQTQRGQDHRCGRCLRRTHCKNGHEFTLENTTIVEGYRACRICRKANVERYLARQREIL
jgi:hypothetical protein